MLTYHIPFMNTSHFIYSIVEDTGLFSDLVYYQ